MIDTHVHLNHDDLCADLPGVLARADAADVSGFLVIGYDPASSAAAVQLSRSDARLFAVVGVHPGDAAGWSDAAAEQMRAWTTNQRVVAVGEIGLDFYPGAHGERTFAPPAVQEKVFRDQIQIARAAQLPVVIHCRDADDQTIHVLKDAAPDIGVILHCFAGERRHAAVAWEQGWYLGIGGSVTFKKNDDLREIVRDTPSELLLLETDAPYLSPAPLRGKHPNEPSRLPLIAQRIAQVRGEETAAVARYTTQNAHQAFPRLTA